MEKSNLELFNRLANDLFSAEKEEPIIQPIAINELDDKLNLGLSAEGVSEEELYESLKNLMLNTPRTSTNRFFNQLFGGRNDKAVLGDLIAVLLNTSMYTYKVAGPMVEVEKVILRQISAFAGYDLATAGGTIATGGSMTNFMALVMARDAFNENIVEQGVNPGMVLYTSAVSHYSIPKNAAFAGIGRNNIRYIEVDEEGRMRVDLLEQQIKQDIAAGLQPFFVNATAGTTVFGAYDPVDQIGDVCQQYGLWLHLDGAYGGSVIFTDKHRHLVKGIEKTNSFSVNAHKMLNAPMTCSMIVCQNKRHLYHSFSNDASYLFQMHEDDYNLGKTSLQCGRRNDALKLWTLWKSVGTKGLAAMVDHQFALAEVAREYVRNHPDYTLYSFDSSLTICFTYKNVPSIELCNKLYESSTSMVSYGSFREQDFVRLVTINAGNKKEDILNFFSGLEDFVAKGMFKNDGIDRNVANDEVVCCS